MKDFEKHARREDEILLAELRRRGVGRIPEFSRCEHAYLAGLIGSLAVEVATALDGGERARANVLRFARRLVRALEDHMIKEEDVVFPLALEVIGPVTWRTIAADGAAAAPQAAHGIF